MRKLCRCHGVSGSCVTKTCWSSLSDFRLVGNHLKQMYKQAIKVDYDSKNRQLDKIRNRDDNMANSIDSKLEESSSSIISSLSSKRKKIEEGKKVF